MSRSLSQDPKSAWKGVRGRRYSECNHMLVLRKRWSNDRLYSDEATIVGKVGFHMASMTAADLLSLNKASIPKLLQRGDSTVCIDHHRCRASSKLSQLMYKIFNCASLHHDFSQPKISIRRILRDGFNTDLLGWCRPSHRLDLLSHRIPIGQQHRGSFLWPCHRRVRQRRLDKSDP